MQKFSLHPRLAEDCFDLGRLDLSRLLLMNDRQYPWFILVPERPRLTELHELHEHDRTRFWEESAQLSRALVALFAPDKLNVANLGNQVPQLHVHHVVRHRDDPAWPGPIWGKLPPLPYSCEQREQVVAGVQHELELSRD